MSYLQICGCPYLEFVFSEPACYSYVLNQSGLSNAGWLLAFSVHAPFARADTVDWYWEIVSAMNAILLDLSMGLGYRAAGFCCLSLILLKFMVCGVWGLNQEGLFLVKLKISVRRDPLSALRDWNTSDSTPCGWNGVTCTKIPGLNESRVISIVLAESRLLGSIPAELGCLQHLRHLDLCSNEINGTIPSGLFNATNLRNLTLCNNAISGSLPPEIQQLQRLQYLDLSGNALTGTIPESITALNELKGISLRNNYFSGPIPRGFGSGAKGLQMLDLSSNLLNESIPPDLGNLTSPQCFLNLSGNAISGPIPPSIGYLPLNATVDLAHNNLSGPIPQIGALLYQKSDAFAGNPGLCDHPLRTVCSIPSTLATAPNISSPSAIAAIPVISKRRGLSKGTVVAIAVGDFAGVCLVCVVFIYRYLGARANKEGQEDASIPTNYLEDQINHDNTDCSSSSGRTAWLCLKKIDDSSEVSSSDNGDQQEGNLVTMGGDLDLEIEKLLRASAYILGANGFTIVYKAVLEDGLTFAVRRLGDGCLERYKDFEAQAKVIGRIRHPNIVRLRGFYWSMDEKLLIHDYIPNGSLSNAFYGVFSGRASSSAYHLPWSARLKIAKGVARGLAYLHEKKYVHGNLKPTNILLGLDMEPHIADFGLDRLVGTASMKCGISAIHFRNIECALSGSKRSTGSRDSLQTTPEMPSSPSTSRNLLSPYQAPETLRTLKSSQKWDVYSFGIIFLEMITGKTPSDKDFAAWNQCFFEDKNRLLRAVDPTIRSEFDGTDEISASLRIGFSCASNSPQKRPSMKETLHLLEKLRSSLTSSATTKS